MSEFGPERALGMAFSTLPKLVSINYPILALLANSGYLNLAEQINLPRFGSGGETGLQPYK
jgi:hypothetical protein